VLDLLGPPEIADALGVSRRTAWRYLERPDFPEPVAQVTSKRLWLREDVEAWAERTLPIPRGRPAWAGRESE
jgi:predicted DNA-binding transcriptional regulator AlpA